jgi:hypothetical protein
LRPVVDQLVVDAFLRASWLHAPVRRFGQIVGRVKLRAGEGPMLELGAGAAVIGTNWADAMSTWTGTRTRNGRYAAGQPHSLHIV